jgi:hypothetical protein
VYGIIIDQRQGLGASTPGLALRHSWPSAFPRIRKESRRPNPESGGAHRSLQIFLALEIRSSLFDTIYQTHLATVHINSISTNQKHVDRCTKAQSDRLRRRSDFSCRQPYSTQRLHSLWSHRQYLLAQARITIKSRTSPRLWVCRI